MSPEDTAPTAGSTMLQAGHQFGVYRVESLLGSGGMAQVFRAVDTRLNRPVAIKVSLERFSERFGREARAIAALNHPNICTLYDVGPDYLVMELVEGETLAARIRRGLLPLNEVLRYGAQMADALAEAHNAGIVHRDLKPGNVMVTRHGVKVLDFGLAKVDAGDATVTQSHVVMGTPAYMAPEQIAGKSVGPQSDLFALGLMLYEMTAGQRPLPDASLGQALLVSRTTAGPVSKMRAEASALDGLITRLLAADPAKRPPNAAAVADELRALVTTKSHVSRKAVFIGITAIVLIGIAVTWWLARRTGEPLRLDAARIVPITNLPGRKLDPSYSPDGASIAFWWLGPDGNSPGIYVREGDAREPRRLTNGNDVSPAWSPDGAEIAFLRRNPTGANELMVVRVKSGPEQKLRDVKQGRPLLDYCRPLLTWTPDGKAIVIPTEDVDAGGRASLYRIGLHGEKPQRLFASTAGDGDCYPAFSPDGRWLAYALSERGSARMFVRRIGKDGLPDGSPQKVPEGIGTNAAWIRNPMWSPDSRGLIFAAGPRLMEWKFGVTSQELWVSGDSFQSLSLHWTGGILSQLVYAKSVLHQELRKLKLDADGRKAEGPPTEFMHRGWISIPQFSPDGNWLIYVSENKSLWIAAADGSNPRLLVNMPAGSGIHFSPDSRHIAFHNPDESFAPLYIVDLNEKGEKVAEHKLVQSDSFAIVGASWSPNDKYLYTMASKTPQRVMRVRVDTGEPEDLFEGATPVVAPDGRRIYYRKGLEGPSALFARSIDGDNVSNHEDEVVSGCVMMFGIVPTRRGIYYVACNERNEPLELRYFEFSSHHTFDLGSPPQGNQPILTLSADRRRLVYHTNLPDSGELTQVSFRPSDR
jgi:Tol biopolymer transport system component